MRGSRLLVVATMFLCGLTAAPTAAASVLPPPPAHDPFYVPPTGYQDSPNGTVLRSRGVTAAALGLPLPATSVQLLYRTTGAHGEPIGTVATVMVPLLPWLGPGPRPLVSYQTAEDSVDSRCAPSYALRTGLPSLTSNAQTETTVIASALARGWGVVTADYEGPTSNFLAGPQEGRGVLDGVRAALSSRFGGLDSRTPVGLWGYSGGAFATAWAVQQQASYAPELRLSGTALGGLPADLEPAMRTIDGGYGAGLVMGGLIGLDRAYPEAGIASLLTPAGRDALAAGAQDCTVDLLLRYAFKNVSDLTVSPTPFDEQPLADVLGTNSPLHHGSTPTTPVYSYHATTDELVPVATADALVASYCAAGTPVEIVRFAIGEHNETLLRGAPGAQDFLARRFAGAPVVDSCPS